MPTKSQVKPKLVPPMITMEVSALKKAFDSVAWVLDPRNTVPVVGNIKLVSEKGRLTLTGTDMDTVIAATIDVDGKSAMATTISAKTLGAILRSCDSAETLSLAIHKDGRAGIGLGDGAEIEVDTIHAGEYPRMKDDGTVGATMDISALQFAELVDRTAFAVSTEQTRYYLNGVCLETFAPRIRMTATDGYKLASHEQTPGKLAGDFKRLILPARPLRGIRKLLGNKITDDDMLRFTVIYSGTPEATPIRITCDFIGKSITLTAKLIDGSFPDYQRVVNKDGTIGTITLKRQELCAILNRIIKMADNNQSAVACFEIAGKAPRRSLTMTIYNVSLGTTTLRMKLPAEITGDAQTFVMKAGYLLEALRSFKNEYVRLDMIMPADPVILYDVGNADGYVLVMPMRV